MAVQPGLSQSGRVGIGTTVPASLLHLEGSAQGDTSGVKLTAGSQNALIYLDNNDLVLRKQSKTDQLVLDGTGRIGIGTNAPAAKMHVIENNEALRMDGLAPYMTFYNGGAYLGFLWHTGSNLRLQNKLGGKLFLGTDDEIKATIAGNGMIGVGTTNPGTLFHMFSTAEGDTTGIKITSLDGITNSHIYNENGDLHLRKASETDQLVLDNLGNVGIGTDAPDGKLHVESASSFAATLNSSAINGTWLSLGNNDTGGKFFHLISSGSNNGAGAGNFMLWGGPSYNTATQLAMAINGNDGRVAIGTTTFGTGYALSVKGKILTNGLRVQSFASWPDYVFEPDYAMPKLSEVAAFIDTNGHLPGFLPAGIVESEGLDMAEITTRQQEWIEVSTMHLIQQEERIRELEHLVARQSEQIARLIGAIENK
ncbi:MAG: hypothetical protein R3301_17455 [Saprospiraceae bacterium]|nr:hypothetical protein [Saprospiraceae bacterium]